MDHLSLNLESEAALSVLRDRLTAAGCEVSELVDHGVLRSIYFTDNNGIALEATSWVTDPTVQSFDPTNAEIFQDPDPVPAVHELAGGALDSLPHTRLV
jgi:catechol-2,3-dioxygenase